MTDPLNLVSELFSELKVRFVESVLGGVPIGIVVLPASILAVFLIYGGMFAGMVPGLALESEGLLITGMFGGMLVGAVGFGLALGLLLGPLYASLARATFVHQEGGERLGLTSCISTIGENLVPLYTFMAIHMIVGTTLTAMCILPGLIWYFLTDLAWLRVALGEDGPIDAIRWNIERVQANPSWHVGYFLILCAMGFIVSYLPLIGTFLSPGILMFWRVYAYRREMLERPAFAA